MATPPDFTSGQILTAAQMNAVGMWRITTCTATSAGGTSATASNGVVTIGTNNTSVTVSNAFSSDFNRYKVLLSGGVSSTTLDIRLSLGSTATGYYGFLMYGAYNTSTVVGFGQNNDAYFGYVGSGSTDALTGNFELDNPFETKRTFVTAQNALAVNTTGVGNTFSGFLSNNTSYSAFTLTASTGNFTGGTICVYGYNN